MAERCLICAGVTADGQEYHARCARAFFGMFPPPRLDLSPADLQEYAAQSVLNRVTVTGVQKKLSLHVAKRGRDARFTVVGLWGNFILKPPVDEYPSLPENEDTVMRMASAIGISTVPHALIRLASGELAYITRRVDRNARSDKIAMEDFCQISGRLTEDKYKGSVERVGKLLRRHSVYPGLDAVDLFQRVVFSYVCGNADMHLKNYSLMETPQGMRLAPAYDLLSTMLVIPDDPEESALPVNGKKSNLTRSDFDVLAEYLDIRRPAYRKVYEHMSAAADAFRTAIDTGRLPAPMKEELAKLIQVRLSALV